VLVLKTGPLFRGFTIFFTGLSAAGKSTLANALSVRLTERTGRPVTLLDGDVVRTNLSQGLGFSREDRDINILRIGFVAGEVTRHGGIAICAAIAPYRSTRRAVRERIEKLGRFIEVYVSTPLKVCEERDPKGLYKKARAGTIEHFTGVSDPYEPPEVPELTLDTQASAPEETVRKIIAWIEKEGLI
jgi:sulfate adenylyltransferase